MSSQLGGRLQLGRQWLTAMLHQIMPSKAMLSPSIGLFAGLAWRSVHESISFLKGVRLVSAVSLLSLDVHKMWNVWSVNESTN